MTLIDWNFAYASYALDAKEEAKKTRNIILQIGMLVAPENTQEIWDKVRLEDELTEDEEKELEDVSKEVFEEKLHNLDADGKVKTDEVVRDMILGRKAAHQPIETLRDLGEKDA